MLIEELVADLKYSNIVIIQPTLALLDETRKKLKKYSDDYSIIVRTSQEPSTEKGNLFLLTAERVMEYQELPKVDLLIIDEFYKLSAKRDDERSDVLNNAFHLILDRDKAKFYLLGPNIDKISDGFIEKYNAVFYKTDYSLVEHIEINKFSSDFGTSGNKKTNKENALFDLLLELKDEQTMIYCSSPSKARKLSSKFLKYIEDRISISQNDISLIEWIENHVSKHWGLIDCLKYQIAFHDGALQKHISSSIIKYFNEKKINFLFCTSTIIEGVNTSAKNIIVFDKYKGRQRKENLLDYFDYSNIRGRAGRMMVHLTGTVYNFNEPINKSNELYVDIPFFEQNPIKDEVLIHLQDNEIKNKDTKQYEDINKIPTNEKKLFKKNGVLVKGQQKILEQLRRDIKTKQKLIIWTGYPSWDNLEYVLSLCWNNLVKEGETTSPMTLKKLIKVTSDYAKKEDIRYLARTSFDYFKKQDRYKNYTKQEILDEAIRDAFNILRHWFQYKVPKWLRVMHTLQEYVCIEQGLSKHGEYTYYANKIESDFVKNNMSLLLEYGIPKSAIKKMEKHISEDLDENAVVNLIKSSDIMEKSKLLQYEMDKINESL